MYFDFYYRVHEYKRNTYFEILIWIKFEIETWKPVKKYWIKYIIISSDGFSDHYVYWQWKKNAIDNAPVYRGRKNFIHAKFRTIVRKQFSIIK